MKKFYFLLLIVLSAVILISCNSNSTEPEQQDDFDRADGIKGGILYDKFWESEASYSKASDASLIAILGASSDFFRCKQCHGWDLLGSSGSYIGRGPRKSRPNVSSIDLASIAKTKSPKELFDAMKKSSGRRDITYNLSEYDPATNPTVGDQMPNYNQLLTDAEIWDIVKFLKNEALDVTQLYDATYTGIYPNGKATFSNVGKDGNSVKGKAYYDTNCSGCHGRSGKFLYMESMSLGQFLRSKPNETQHKVKFGQLGSAMGAFKTTLIEMKDLYKAVADTTMFPN